MAEGIIDCGLTYFVLIYYSQVLGLPATLTAFSIAIDAVSDPLVGWWSDHFRSRLGRRHFFIYASIVPLSFSYYLIWVPPESLSESGLFTYLLVMCVCLQLARTLYSIPMIALVPEFTRDYDERTAIMNVWSSSLYLWAPSRPPRCTAIGSPIRRNSPTASCAAQATSKPASSGPCWFFSPPRLPHSELAAKFPG